jgi:bacillithiol system protein YtxJ
MRYLKKKHTQMGLFSAFKKEDSTKSPKEIKKVPWIDLNTIDQLLEIKEESNVIPVAIFKHSTRCVISRMVLRDFEDAFAIDDSKMKLYFLDLLSNRNISNEIGSEFQVFHQSPQLIVIKNGEAIYHASHNDIQAGNLKRFI